MPPKSKTKAKKAPKGRGKSTAKAKPAVVVVGSKVMTLQQKQKEEERRLKEFILTRSYGQLQERVEDISERLQELRDGYNVGAKLADAQQGVKWEDELYKRAREISQQFADAPPSATEDDYNMKLEIPDLSGIMTPSTRQRIPTEKISTSTIEPKNLLQSLGPPTSASTSTSTSTAVVKKEEHTTPPVPIVEKKDTYYDFLLKEMMWLSEDFSAERNRHKMSARKLSNAVKLYHSNKEQREQRQASQQLNKTKSIAKKLSRDVKSFWAKIERVITYKQKVSADESRRKDMDKHLVFLVKQTEKYGEKLVRGEVGANDEEGENKTIEEVLASEEWGNKGDKRKKAKKINYSRMKVEEEEFYGESTADEHGMSDAAEDDEDFELGREEKDDETTLIEEEKMMGANPKAEFDAEIEELKNDMEVPVEELFRQRNEMEEGMLKKEKQSRADSGDEADNDGDGDESDQSEEFVGEDE
ncbi:hypothetical protein TrVE_jg7582, partial [Triparma verrucosa]